MRSRTPFVIASIAAIAACVGERPVVLRAQTEPFAAHWRVESVTRSRSGGDIDDGGVLVSLVIMGAASSATLPAGQGFGVCTTTPSYPSANVCTEGSSGTLVTRLVCGSNPHIDRVLCFDAVRSGASLDVSRYEYDVPVADDPPPAPTLIGRTRVGGVEVAGTPIHVLPIEFRDITEP